MKRSSRRILTGALVFAASGLLTEPAATVPQLARVTEQLGISSTAWADNYGTSRRVARRTSRRTSARVSGGYGAYGYGAGVATAAAVGIATIPVGVTYVSTLPGGCGAVTVGAVSYQRCGSVYYRPYYQGETVVYVQEAPPQ